MCFFHSEIVLFFICISKKDRQLIEYLQRQNTTLLITLKSQFKTIEYLSQEIKAVKKLLLEQNGVAQKLNASLSLSFLKRLKNVNIRLL